MAANPQLGGMALVSGGWTGALTLTVGVVSVVVSVPARTSPFEAMTIIARTGQRTHGGTWDWFVDIDGKINITSTLTFTLSATGTVQTRLGFTATYTGASSYIAASAHVDGVYPSLGLLLDGADGVARGGVALATGTYVSAVGRRDQGGEIVLYGTHAELAPLAASFTEARAWDVGLGGNWAARVRIEGVSRRPWGVDPERTTLVLATTEATL